MTIKTDSIQQLCINTVRLLSGDAVQKANSGHPGTPWRLLRMVATLFMHADQVEAAWKALMPIINSWATNPSVSFPNYKAGAEGPEDAEILIARFGHSWV